MVTILFVCAGNTCRSPMAQALFVKRLHHRVAHGGEEYRAISAGLAALDGLPATREAISVLREEGINLEGHRAVLLREILVAEAELILTMTLGQRDYLREHYPQKAQYTYTISEFADTHSGDVVDPYGGGLTEYRACRDQLKILVDELFNKIIESRMR